MSKAKGLILRRTVVREVNLDGFIYDDWAALLDKVAVRHNYTIMEPDEAPELYIFKVSRWGTSHFDNIAQVFYLPVYDRHDRPMDIAVNYSAINKPMIEKMEAWEKDNLLPDLFLGYALIKVGKLTALPIAAYFEDGEIINLTLD